MKISYPMSLWLGSHYWSVTLILLIMFIPSYLTALGVTTWEFLKETVELFKEVPYKKEQYERYKER